LFIKPFVKNNMDAKTVIGLFIIIFGFLYIIAGAFVSSITLLGVVIVALGFYVMGYRVTHVQATTI